MFADFRLLNLDKITYFNVIRDFDIAAKVRERPDFTIFSDFIV